MKGSALGVELSKLARAAAFANFEELMTSADGFGLTTATPVQRAIMRAAEGRPLGDLWDDPNVRVAFGCPPNGPYDEVLVIAGIRGGKSLIAAGGSVYQTQRCSFAYGSAGHKLGPGEMPRVSVLSIRKDTANVVFQHIVGNVMNSPFLRNLLMGEPTADSVTLRHPSGRPVEVKVVAGAKAGSTLVARWSAGVVFDEAPRMQSAEEGVINLPHMRAAVKARLLKGARIWYIGSPNQPYGLPYEWKNEFWGKPSSRVLVVVAPAQVMNPFLWTDETVAELRASDPEVARTDLDAEFADPETALFANDRVVSSMRADSDIEPEEGTTYVAAMDPATRGNGWAMAVGCKRNGKLSIVVLREQRGTRSSPLDPREVIRDYAGIWRRYGIQSVITDQWAADAIRVFLDDEGFGMQQEDFRGIEKANAYISLARRVEAGLVELYPDEQLRIDLVSVKRRVTSDGVKIVLPTTSDGRHADMAPVVVAALAQHLEDAPPPPPRETRDEIELAEDHAIERFLDPDWDLWDPDEDEGWARLEDY